MFMRKDRIVYLIPLLLCLLRSLSVDAAEPDYVLGRLMTDEEIAAVEEAVAPFAGQGGYLAEEKPEQWDTPLQVTAVGESVQYPSCYDIRQQGISLQIKEQRYGDCWAFATIDMLQIGAQLRGISGAEDLSERHLVYYTYHSVGGNRGQQAGEGTTFIDSGNAEKCFFYGGKFDYAIRTLGAYVGAVRENVYPYAQAAEPLPDSPDAAYGEAALRLQNAYIVNAYDRCSVKEKIMEFGSVGITYCSSLEYYNYHTAAQYCPTPTSADHAVVVIGWDDMYSRENFKEKPSEDGAWLVKNSWGTVFGEAGYFWLSYEDASIAGRAYAMDVTGVDNFEHIYQCDNTLLDGQLRGEGELAVANSYVVGEEGAFWERLDAVSITVPIGGMEYSLQLYMENAESTNGDPEKGDPLLTAPISGWIDSPGLYTVNIDEEIQVPPDSRIFIVIFLRGERPAISTDTTGTSMYTVCSSVGGEGISYYKNEGTWTDYGVSENKNFRIKLFTQDMEQAETMADIYGQYLKTDNAYEAVSLLYDRLLYREGEMDGVAYWIQRRQESPPIEILAGFLFSDEYQRRFPNRDPWSLLRQAAQIEYNADLKRIVALYDEILGRNYDLTGLMDWARAMDNGMLYEEVRRGFLESEEYINLVDFSREKW